MEKFDVGEEVVVTFRAKVRDNERAEEHVVITNDGDIYSVKAEYLSKYEPVVEGLDGNG